MKYRRLIHAGFKCEDCGAVYMGKRPRGAAKYFHLHHQTYARVGSELLEDVLILCPSCHFKPWRHPWRIDK